MISSTFKDEIKTLPNGIKEDIIYFANTGNITPRAEEYMISKSKDSKESLYRGAVMSNADLVVGGVINLDNSPIFFASSLGDALDSCIFCSEIDQDFTRNRKSRVIIKVEESIPIFNLGEFLEVHQTPNPKIKTVSVSTKLRIDTVREIQLCGYELYELECHPI